MKRELGIVDVLILIFVQTVLAKNGKKKIVVYDYQRLTKIYADRFKSKAHYHLV